MKKPLKYTQLKEHQVVAYCLAYLISKKVRIDNIAVKEYHIKEVDKILARALRNKYRISIKRIEKMINNLPYNLSREDIKGTYFHERNRANRKIIIEAKGGNEMYAIYTVIGQLICSRDSSSPYWWYGFSCPESWKSEIHKRLSINGKIRPIISVFITEFTRKGQGLNFYFVRENGDVESITWKRFLSKNIVS